MNRKRIMIIVAVFLILAFGSLWILDGNPKDSYYAPIRDCSLNPNYVAFVGEYGMPSKFGLTWFWQRYNPNGVAYYMPDWGQIEGTRIYAVSSDFCVQITDAAGRSIIMWIPMRGFLDFTFVLQRHFQLPLLLSIYVW